MSSENLHERFEDLTPATRELHRAIVSLIEELEAIDWYQQRVDASEDEELKAVLTHNLEEEIEHAMMNLEWLRRHHPKVDEAARTFLFRSEPIVEIEEAAEHGDEAVSGRRDDLAEGPSADGTLGIGSLRLT